MTNADFGLSMEHCILIFQGRRFVFDGATVVVLELSGIKRCLIIQNGPYGTVHAHGTASPTCQAMVALREQWRVRLLKIFSSLPSVSPCDRI